MEYPWDSSEVASAGHTRRTLLRAQSILVPWSLSSLVPTSYQSHLFKMLELTFHELLQVFLLALLPSHIIFPLQASSKASVHTPVLINFNKVVQ